MSYISRPWFVLALLLLSACRPCAAGPKAVAYQSLEAFRDFGTGVWETEVERQKAEQRAVVARFRGPDGAPLPGATQEDVFEALAPVRARQSCIRVYLREFTLAHGIAADAYNGWIEHKQGSDPGDRVTGALLRARAAYAAFKEARDEGVCRSPENLDGSDTEAEVAEETGSSPPPPSGEPAPVVPPLAGVEAP